MALMLQYLMQSYGYVNQQQYQRVMYITQFPFILLRGLDRDFFPFFFICSIHLNLYILIYIVLFYWLLVNDFLKIGTWNIEGLSTKLDNTDFISIISNFDIISLVETWLPYGQNVDIAGFYSFSKCRK